MKQYSTGQCITIIGQYGFDELFDENEKISSDVRLQAKPMEAMFKLYSEFYLDAYSKILEKYHIRIGTEKLIKSKGKSHGYALSEGLITLAKNFDSFSEHYAEIEERLKIANNSDWLPFITGTKRLKGNNVKTYDIKNDLIKAIEYNIHFSLFIGGKYDRYKLKHLAGAVDNYQRDEDFKKVMKALLSGLATASEESFYMPLQDYNLLITTQKDMIRAVATLFYGGRKWKSKNQIKLDRLPFNEFADAYLANYTIGKDDTFKLMEQTYNKAS